MDFSKPDRKQVRAFSLSPEVSALIDRMAAEHNVPASRIVDLALEKYLTHLAGSTPKTDDQQEQTGCL